jgi:hypothetical protein
MGEIPKLPSSSLYVFCIPFTLYLLDISQNFVFSIVLYYARIDILRCESGKGDLYSVLQDQIEIGQTQCASSAQSF